MDLDRVNYRQSPRHPPLYKVPPPPPRMALHPIKGVKVLMEALGPDRPLVLENHAPPGAP